MGGVHDGLDDRVGRDPGARDQHAGLERARGRERHRCRGFRSGRGQADVGAAIDRVVDEPTVGHGRKRNVARVRVATEEDAGGAAGGDDVVADHHARHEASRVEHRQARRHALIGGVGADVPGTRVDADAVGEGVADRVALDQELSLLPGLVGIAESAIAGDQIGIGVDRLIDEVVGLERVDLSGELRAPPDLELVVALQALGGHRLRRGRRASREEVGLAGGGAGDHLAPLREAHHEIVDVEPLVAVVLATGGLVEVAGGARDAVDLVDERAGGIPRRGIHFTGGAEVEPQAEVGLVGIAAQIDPGLPPRPAVEQLLDVLIRIGRKVGRHRGERRQFGVALVHRGASRVVGGHDGPCHAGVLRDEGPGAVHHATVHATGCIGFGLQPVVEIERRLVGVLVAREAEGIRRQAAIGAARQVVAVGNGRIGGEVLLPGTILDAVLPIGGLVIQIVRAGASILLEPEVHAHATLGLGGVFIVALSVEDNLVCRAVAGVIGSDIDAVAGVGRPVGRGVPEIDVERREGEASGAENRRVDVLRVGDAVFVAVEHLLERSGGVKRPQSAGAVDRKQRVLQRPAVEILWAEGEAAEVHGEAGGILVTEGIDLQRAGDKQAGGRIEVDERGDAVARVDRKEIAVGIDTVERAVHVLHAGDDAQPVASILDVAHGSPGLPRDGGGRAIRWVGAEEPRGGPAGADRVVEVGVRRRAGLAPCHGIDGVGGERTGRSGEVVGHAGDGDVAQHDRARPDDGDRARAAVDVAGKRRLQSDGHAADWRERCDDAASAGREGPRC